MQANFTNIFSFTNISIMKKLLIVLLMISALSCKKESKTCYQCQIRGFNGQTQYDRDFTQCVDNESELQTHYQDPNGNDMSCICQKK